MTPLKKWFPDAEFYCMKDVHPLLYIMSAILIVLTLLVILGGCSMFQTQVGPTAKKVVDYYCTQPLEARLLARAEIAKAIAPATLTLVCPGDTVTPSGPHLSKADAVLPAPGAAHDHDHYFQYVGRFVRDPVTYRSDRKRWRDRTWCDGRTEPQHRTNTIF